MRSAIKEMINCTLFALLLAIAGGSVAQPVPGAKASIDTTVIRLGEQFRLDVFVTVPKNAHVKFPVIPDSIQKLEVVSRTQIDTSVSADGSLATFHQQLTLTGFDSGFFVIEPVIFHFTSSSGNTDSFATEPLLMQVQTIPVDTTQAIKDIKPPMEVPFTFREAIPYIMAGLAALGIGLGLAYWLKNRKKKPVAVISRVKKRLPHEIAFEELQKIQEKKLWQQGFYKEYQSAVSDTIRQYIEDRFGITAMEMPSDDTLHQVKNISIHPEAFEKLSGMLHLADMVKFAKSIPVGTENERSMQQALDFISLTKPVTREDFDGEHKEKEAAA